MIQDLIVISIIVVSIFFLGRHLRSFIKGEICCECPSSRRKKSCCPVKALAEVSAQANQAQPPRTKGEVSGGK